MSLGWKWLSYNTTSDCLKHFKVTQQLLLIGLANLFSQSGNVFLLNLQKPGENLKKKQKCSEEWMVVGSSVF